MGFSVRSEMQQLLSRKLLALYYFTLLVQTNQMENGFT
jgi:hypothetical protein